LAPTRATEWVFRAFIGSPCAFSFAHTPLAAPG
jgi:hypothetical protein